MRPRKALEPDAESSGGAAPLAPSPLRPYLTTHQAVAYLGVGSLSALYRLIDQQALPFCRMGRVYRFDYRELDAWMRRHREQ